MNSQALLLWGTAYVFPAVIAAFVVFQFSKSKYYQYVGIHICLLVSIALSLFLTARQEAGDFFDFHFITFVLFFVTLAAGAAALGRIGFFYGASTFIQQLCLQSTVLLLLPYAENLLIFLLVVPIYMLAHLLMPHKWQLQALVTAAWGVISILMFISTRDIFLVSAIHAGGGLLLMLSGILYPWSEI